ncbi:MAG: hypothetical protein Kow0020_11130 [Wenzhouxiangellaceae bacterium]
MKLLLSIHDVTPATLGRVEAIFERLQSHGLWPVTLLVVPGLGWSDDELDRLRQMVDAGARLAGHGWRHEAAAIRGFRHRLHSLLLSRNAAEHLALAPRGILRLMLANHRWFVRQALPEPVLYVPPAWAMGPVPRPLLARLPFALYETLSGVWCARTGRMHRLPLAGFEADTAWRAFFVRASNGLNAQWARLAGRPLRLGIHPMDFELRLARDLQAWIESGGEVADYASLIG